MKTKYDPVIVFLLKLVLGITFIVASYPKIQDPAAFARIVYGYAIFPAVSINLIAIILPFIELTAGISLIMRFFPRPALLLINILLGIFVLVISFNLLRGHSFDCGCFSVADPSSTHSAIFLLIRDLVLLGAGIFVWKKTCTKEH